MKVTDFLEFRNKCRFIITEMRHTCKVPMNFYIDDVAILDITDLDCDKVKNGHIKNYPRIAKALQEYNANCMVRIDYLIHGSSNIHYEYIPAKYLLPEYSEEDITKDLQKRVQLAKKLEINISDIEDVYSLMTVRLE